MGLAVVQAKRRMARIVVSGRAGGRSGGLVVDDDNGQPDSSAVNARDMSSRLRTIALWLLALFFILAGLNHFLNPGVYHGLMPAYLPWHRELILVSGGAEMAGGLAILVPRLRDPAGWGLIALLVAVFPANLHVALHGWVGVQIPSWVLWARLPVQGLFIAWVWWACIARSAPR